MKKEMNNNIFNRIQKAYVDLENRDLELKEKFDIYAQIAQNIIDFCFIKNNRNEKFDLIKNSRSKNLKVNKTKVVPFEIKPYKGGKDNYEGKLRFLCDFSYIPPKFEYTFKLLLEINKQSDKKINNGLEHDYTFFALHELLNIILSWFYESESKSINFIKKLNIIAENNLAHQKVKEKIINTFFNIKNNYSWFEKYSTLISYLIALSSIFTALIIFLYQSSDFLYFFLGEIEDNESLVITIFFFQIVLITIVSLIGLLNTMRLVKKRVIRLSRFFIYGFGLLPLIFLFISSLTLFFNKSQNLLKFLSPEDENHYFFDQDPNDNSQGFFFVSSHKTSKNKFKKKDISTDSIKMINDQVGVFYLIMDVKNIGNRKIDSLTYGLKYKKINSSDIRIQITPFLFNSQTSDMVKIIKNEDETVGIIGCSIIHKKMKINNNYNFIEIPYIIPEFNKYYKLPDIYPIGHDSIFNTSVVFTFYLLKNVK